MTENENDDENESDFAEGRLEGWKPKLHRSVCTVVRSYGDVEGSRPVAICGKIPRAKIRTTMIHMATSESLLTGIAATLGGAGCQYIALTTFK